MICRMCLVHFQEHIKIFEYQGLQLSIAAIIAKYFWFEPKVEDPVSNCICKSCWAQISNFHSYYSYIEEAQKKLSQTSFVKEEVAIDYDSEEGQTENVQDENALEVNLKTTIQCGNGAKRSQTESRSITSNLNEMPKLEKMKRGRGRPRKIFGGPRKLLENKPIVKQSDVRIAKHKYNVGRPRKLIPPLVEIPNLEISKKDDEGNEPLKWFNAENKSSKIPKKRGRPRKVEKLDKPNSVDSSVIADIEEQMDITRSDRLRRKAQVNYCEIRKYLPNNNEQKRKEKKEKNPGPSEYVRKSKEADEHIAKHMKLKCDACTAEFTTFAELLAHYRMVHNIRGYVTCCNKKFSKRILLLEHINKHLNPDYFRCEVCGKTFADRQCLKGHRMLMHEPDELKVHKCDKCPRSYSKLYFLERHKLIHVPLEEREYNCDDCGKAFPSKNYLTSHMRSVHENAYGVMCHICAKVIQGKTLLQKHQLQHAGIVEPKMQCKECGSWLKNKYSLKKHMDRHAERYEELLNPQMHECNVCGKISPSKAALRSHIKYVHISGRSHECTICMKSFKKALTLKEHMTTHTGEVLYTCPYCPKTFNSSANMHSHRKKNHRTEWDETRRMRESERELFKSNQEEIEEIFGDVPIQLPVEVVYGDDETKSENGSADFGCKENDSC